MSGHTVILAGPSLLERDKTCYPQFTFVPPAARGDILRLLTEAPKQIGLIDGVFDDQPAVLHKELLEAMAEGVSVYGASSMGALRAAELQTFGMIGVGKIFTAYHHGRLIRDADVAVTYGPEALGFPALTVPQVEVCATVRALEERGNLSRAEANRIIAVSEGIFYKNRSWQSLADALEPQPEAQARLSNMLESAHVPAKRLDALALLERMSRDASRSAPRVLASVSPPLTPVYKQFKADLFG